MRTLRNAKSEFVAFSVKGQTVISYSSGLISVWNADTGTLVVGPPTRRQHAEGGLITGFNRPSG